MINQATFQAEDVFSISGRGTIVVGKLTEGIAKKGMRGIVNGKQSEILEIEAQHQSLESLTTGIPAGLLLSNIEKSDIQKGNEYRFQ